MANLPLHMGSRVQEGEGGGVTQHACLHFAESRSSVFLQSFAHFLWPTPPQPGFALGLHRRCTFFESFFVHVVGSSSAAQLSMDGGGLGGGGGGGGGGLSVLSMAQISLYASKKLESNVAQKSYAQFSSIVVPQPASQAARAVAGSMPAMAQT